ncbi:MAG TPA: hypothetical protein VN602_09110 [Gemmatimonadaceae bacterium]|nr:hypothetical protein [Gemmatimonadaceae bacterium]
MLPVLQRYRPLVAALDAMSDVLVQFDEPQLSADGRMFTAEVRGNRLPTGLWEAWIEFQPRIGGDPVRTPRETEQLSRGDLRFWAAGITRDQLRDALARALAPHEAQHADASARVTDTGDTVEDEPVLETTQAASDDPVLDPFAVYRHSGEYTLRQELRGLDAQQLADIIGKYRIADIDVIDLARTYEDALAERIVADVQHNVDTNRTPSPAPESRAEK